MKSMQEIKLQFPDLRSLLIFVGNIKLKKFTIDKQFNILEATLSDAELELALNGFKALHLPQPKLH